MAGAYLLRGVEIARPNQVRAMDITYIPMARGLVYVPPDEMERDAVRDMPAVCFTSKAQKSRPSGLCSAPTTQADASGILTRQRSH
jgi:hypothetical protein